MHWIPASLSLLAQIFHSPTDVSFLPIPTGTMSPDSKKPWIALTTPKKNKNPTFTELDLNDDEEDEDFDPNAVEVRNLSLHQCIGLWCACVHDATTRTAACSALITHIFDLIPPPFL